MISKLRGYLEVQRYFQKCSSLFNWRLSLPETLKLLMASLISQILFTTGRGVPYNKLSNARVCLSNIFLLSVSTSLLTLFLSRNLPSLLLSFSVPLPVSLPLPINLSTFSLHLSISLLCVSLCLSIHLSSLSVSLRL